MMMSLLAAMTALGAGLAAAANGPGVALTVYNNDLGLVKDVRSVNLESGRHEIRFDDVAARIDPTSVHFRALEHPNQVALQEQNFQYDLADADRLLSRYLGRTVNVEMKEDGAESGTLLSYDGMSLVLQKSGGGVSVLNRAEVRNVSLGDLPGGLVVKPTLVWTLDSDRSGQELVEVSYLTGGINWHAEYVAVVNADDTKLDLTGWVSIDNQSGATYENAKLKLVAGEVHRVQPPMMPMPQRMKEERAMVGDAAAQFAQEAFFEYHLYTLERPATVRDRETKQLSLFPGANASITKKMTFDARRGAKNLAVSIELVNSKANGLGMPLPKGIVRVYKQGKDGAQEFVGEDRIEHTAVDEKIRLTLGNAFDVVAERTETDHQRIDERTQKMSVKIEVRNHKDQAVDVSIVEQMPGDWTITAKSHDYRKTDAHTIEFPVTVPANGSVTVTYTVRFRY
jgi:hypothetical protein